MLSTNKAITAVLAIMLAFGLLILSSAIYNSLSEPEFYNGYVVTVNGIEQGNSMPNPNYITGTKRAIYQFFSDFLPVSQGIQMANLELFRPVLSMASSVFIAAATSFAGVLAFRRKDLK